jgi:hypothetical protein
VELTPELFRQIWLAAQCSANRGILDGTTPDAFLNHRLKEVVTSMKAANGERPRLLVNYLRDWGADVPESKEGGELWQALLASLLTDVEYAKCEAAANRLLARRTVKDKRKAIDEFKESQ